MKTDIGEIRIFSRDEKKQGDMRYEFQTKMPEVADKIKFCISDDALNCTAYTDENVSTKVVEIIQSYVAIINNMARHKV